MRSAPIAVFFALKNESGYFEDRLENAEHLHGHGFRLVSGSLNGQEFLSIVTGMGIRNAQSVMETVCRSHQPRLVISSGFAGGLDPSLPKGGLFLADEILPAAELVGEKLEGKLSENGAFLEGFRRSEKELLSVSLRLRAEDIPKELRSKCRVGGRLLTVSSAVGDPKDKRELAFGYRAQVVDMESWAAARVCREMGLPFLSLRAVSDTADETLPRDVQKLVRQKSAASRAGAALQLLFQRPGSFKDLYRLYDSSVECALNLADFLEAFSRMEKLRFLSENFFPPQESAKLLH